MAGICTSPSPSPSPYPIEKIGDSPYPYPVNAGIPCQNGDEFGQYPRGWVYLPSLDIGNAQFFQLGMGMRMSMCTSTPSSSPHPLYYPFLP